MCGIAGIFHLDGAPADTGFGQRMNDSLSHRGPDGEGLWADGPILLAHRRLSIRDLSASGRQPMFSADSSVVITYNGEIYNDDDLADKLARETGFSRRTSCDAEIIPAAYLAWGEDAFARFEGMFAIALWDREKRKLLLARDGIGIKPLHYFSDDRFVCFASEIKALLANPMIPRRLSAPDVAHMLGSGYTAPNRTLLENVRQVDPGSVVSIDRTGVRQRRYWQPARRGEIKDLGLASKRLVSTLREVVEDQLVSDVPVGVLQSGGVDSSLVSLSLPASHEVPLFSVRFSERSHDESELVNEIASLSKRKITWVDLPQGGDAESSFRQVVRAVDGQLADSSALAALKLAEVTSDHVKVALSGDGGDEFFGGYPTYRATQIASPLQRLLPRTAWGALARSARLMARPSDTRIPASEQIYRFLYGLSQEVPHVAWRHYLPRDLQQHLYGPDLRDLVGADPLSLYSAPFREDSGDLIDRALLADQKYYLPADMLTKVDRVSMACGLEVRVPLLDRRIMELAGELDQALLFDKRGSTKIVLREALRALGAGRNITEGRKRGFNVPMNKLLRTDLLPMARMYLERNAEIFLPFLSPDGVRSLWKSHCSRKRDEKYLVWTLLTLAVWRDSTGI
jgi:asparagine synthase (glutamine-hydrolysing)